MNRTIFLASIFALYPIATIAQNADGFQGAKWGDTKQAVEAVFKGALTQYSSRAVNGKTYPHYGLPKYDIEGCDLNADFTFNNNRLSKVSLSLNNPDGSETVECPAKVVKMLTGKYGSPKIIEPFNPGFSEGHKRIWIVGNTKITQVDSFLSALKRTILTLRYEPSSP
jgi:hypothetical protein